MTKQTITLVSRRHEGAFTYEEVVNYSLGETGVYFAFDSHYLFAGKPILVSASVITACSTHSWGSGRKDAVLRVSELEVEVAFQGVRESVLKWCAQKGIPVVDAAEQREWLYAPKPN